jgi:hypothetical protein
MIIALSRPKSRKTFVFYPVFTSSNYTKNSASC